MDVDGDPGCLDYIWVRGPITVDSCRARVRPPGGRRPDALPVGPLRAAAPGSGSAADGVRRFGSPTAATGAPRRRTPSRRCRRRSRSRAATASSSTSGAPLDGVPVLLHDADARARAEGPDRPASTLTADELAEHGIPTLRRGPRRGRLRPLPRRRAEGARSTGAIDAARAGARPRRRRRPAGAAQRGRLVVRRRRSSPGSRRERPTWPRWLNAYDLSAGDDRARAASSAARRSPPSGTRSTRPRRARRATRASASAPGRSATPTTTSASRRSG